MSRSLLKMTYMIFMQMLCTPYALVESVVHVRPNHEPLLSRPLTVHQAWLCYRTFAYSVFVDVYKSGQLLSSDSMAFWKSNSTQAYLLGLWKLKSVSLVLEMSASRDVQPGGYALARARGHNPQLSFPRACF